MLLKVRQALAQANLTVDDVGPPTLLVQLLLGSIPPTVAAQLGGNSLGNDEDLVVTVDWRQCFPRSPNQCKHRPPIKQRMHPHCQQATQ